MSNFTEHAEVYNQPLLLTKREIAKPYLVLKKFCLDYGLFEVRQSNWDQLQTCLTTENVPYAEPEERSNLMYRHERFGKLLEAVYLISSQLQDEKDEEEEEEEE
jgi:hypothetical protein